MQFISEKKSGKGRSLKRKETNKICMPSAQILAYSIFLKKVYPLTRAVMDRKIAKM
jgi:hypothetical protein